MVNRIYMLRLCVLIIGALLLGSCSVSPVEQAQFDTLIDKKWIGWKTQIERNRIRISNANGLYCVFEMTFDPTQISKEQWFQDSASFRLGFNLSKLQVLDDVLIIGKKYKASIIDGNQISGSVVLYSEFMDSTIVCSFDELKKSCKSGEK